MSVTLKYFLSIKQISALIRSKSKDQIYKDLILSKSLRFFIFFIVLFVPNPCLIILRYE
jgi:hypothetical protein